MSNWFHRHVSPRLIDAVCSTPAINRQRAKVVPCAVGRVLEVGFGSGANLPFYDAAKVERLFALEPDPNMRRLAAGRVADASLDLEFLDLPGEEIPLEDASVDTVVVTYTLCTIPDAAAAAEQMRRVIKPGGALLFAEHGRDPSEAVYWWQRRIEPVWTPIADGCHLTRDPVAILRDAGFRTDHEQGVPPGAPVMNACLRFAAYQYWGAARPA